MALSWLDCLSCIGRPLVKMFRGLLNAVGGGVLPLGDCAVEIANNVLDALNKQKDHAPPQAALATLAQAPQDQLLHQEVAKLVQQIAPGQPREVQTALEAYLVQVPARVRQALRRPADPTGTTLPPVGLVVDRPEHLLPFLPTRLPRFRPGDRPAGVGDWELVELLGIGGFGEVWKARNLHLPDAEPVALKFCLDPAAAKILRHEAALLGRVMSLSQGRPAGIVRLLHTYLSAETPCLEYEYVPGGDLAGIIRQQWSASGGAPPDLAASIVRELAAAVGFAHRLNPPIVHRDLKPANVLLQSRDGRDDFKIADFGIGGLAAGQALVQQTRAGTTPGYLAETVRGSFTPLYASPQQAQHAAPDVRDDVYALGVIWYQLLIGDLAAGAPRGKHWKKRLEGKGMASKWTDLLESCVEDQPADRPADAAVLASLLPSTSSDPPTSDPVRKAVRPAAVGLLLAGLAAAVIGFIASLTVWDRGFKEGQPSEVAALFWSLIILQGSVTAVAALQMLRLRHYGLALAGSFLAFFPVLGFLLGAWALAVLFRPDVRAAFQGVNPDSTQRVRDVVQGPAVGLLVSGSVAVVFGLIVILGAAVHGVTVPLFLLLVVQGGVAIVAALRMLSLQRYGLALAASVLILFGPLLVASSLFSIRDAARWKEREVLWTLVVECCWGLPLGLWALVMLLRSDVKRAFR
jgi:hypothetical protein